MQCLCLDTLPHVFVSDAENWNCGEGDESPAPGCSSVLVGTLEFFLLLLTLQSQTIFANIFPNLFLTCSGLALQLIGRVLVLQENFLVRIICDLQKKKKKNQPFDLEII